MEQGAQRIRAEKNCMEDYFYFIITLHSNIAGDVVIRTARTFSHTVCGRLAYLKLSCIILCISSSESA